MKGGTIFDQILLAIDGSDSALHAAKVAGDLARAVHPKELRIVVAYEPAATYIGEQTPLNGNMGTSQEILQGAEDSVGDVPTQIHSELIEGQITEAVINAAKMRHCDLIIMGSQGMGRLSGALLGINGQKVVSEAPCPVLIVQ